jgi:hypothetical protein
VPEQLRSKPYRVYRGGHVRKDDPDAVRFAFGGSGVGTAERPVTPPGMTRPGTPPPPPSPLPGRQVATVPPRRRFRPGWKRGILLGLGAIVVLLVFWLYLGCLPGPSAPGSRRPRSACPDGRS